MKACKHELYNVMIQISTKTAKNTHRSLPYKYCVKCQQIFKVRLEAVTGAEK